MNRSKRSRRAAEKFRVTAIAAAWRVSPAAVLAAAAVLGIRPLGAFIIAVGTAINDNPEFFKEARFQQSMLDSATARRAA